MLVLVIIRFGVEAVVGFCRIQIHQLTAGAHHISYHSQL